MNGGKTDGDNQARFDEETVGLASDAAVRAPTSSRAPKTRQLWQSCRALLGTYVSQLKTYSGRNDLFWRANYFIWPLLLSVARFYRQTLAARTRLVVVVGSYGKTTATRAANAVLGIAPDRWSNLNANCFSLVPLALLRRFPAPRHAVIEVGVDGPGQMRRYARALRPDIVVVMSIGNEHIQSYRDLSHLREEEAIMVRGLAPGGTAVLNGDDPNVMWMAGAAQQRRIITFGLGPRHDVFATDYAIDWPNGARFSLHHRQQRHEVRTRLIGRPMLYPLLAAAAVRVAEGMSLAGAVEHLEGLPPTPGRMQPIRLPCGATVLRDDYKSTVDTVHAALDVLREIPAKRHIVVLGGLDSPPAPQRPWHIAVGEHVARVADRAVFIGIGFKDYRPGIRRGGMPLEAVTHVDTVAEAARVLHGTIGPGDVVLVKGRTTQRLTRVILLLAGREVRCRVDPCRLNLHFCERCPLLSRHSPA